MNVYTPAEFFAQYGGVMKIHWEDITHIVVNDIQMNYYKGDDIYIELPYTFTGQHYLPHGLVKEFNQLYRSETLYNLGFRHNTEGPASCTWRLNGQIDTEEWYIDNKLHREDGPAIKTWYDDGPLYYESYYIHGLRHRENDLPAFYEYYPSGLERRKFWCTNGMKHRVNGPAWLMWDENGMLIEEKWYLNGVEIEHAPAPIELPEEDDILELPDRWEHADPEFD